MSTRTPLDVAIRPWMEFGLDAQLAFFVRNREAFAPWEPTRPPEYFEARGQRMVNEHAQAEWEAGRQYAYGVSAAGHGLVGRVSLMNILRGAAQTADVGYLVDAGLWGHGIATSALSLTLHEAFATLGLHRLEASIMPRNVRSIRVVEKSGFTTIGLSPRHLRINGVWEDHVLFALTAEQWSPQ